MAGAEDVKAEVRDRAEGGAELRPIQLRPIRDPRVTAVPLAVGLGLAVLAARLFARR